MSDQLANSLSAASAGFSSADSYKRKREELEREENDAKDAALARVVGGASASGLSPQTAVKRQRDDDDSDDEEEEPVDLHGEGRVD